MSNYHYLCYDVFTKYTDAFGGAPLDEDQLTVFNITGEYRNRIYENYNTRLQRNRIQMFLASIVVLALTNNWIIFIITMMTIRIATRPINSNVTKIVNINGREMAVAIPTQEQEGVLEARNFEETKDVQRLYSALNLDIKQKKKIVVVSVGSTSSQVIYGHEHITKTEFDMGVDNRNNLIDVLDSVTNNGGGCDYVCFMNAIGYGIKVDAGVVVSDNNVDTVTENITPRTVGGTGNNVAAMTLVQQLLEIHKSGKFDYKIAFVPRGDPTMPQGGSHSKQRLVDAIRSSNGLPVTVIEISGKQTKMFYIDAKDNDWELDSRSTEELCKLIKEKKIVDDNGKTYGSGHIFA